MALLLWDHIWYQLYQLGSIEKQKKGCKIVRRHFTIVGEAGEVKVKEESVGSLVKVTKPF